MHPGRDATDNDHCHVPDLLSREIRVERGGVQIARFLLSFEGFNTLHLPGLGVEPQGRSRPTRPPSTSAFRAPVLQIAKFCDGAAGGQLPSGVTARHRGRLPAARRLELDNGRARLGERLSGADPERVT